MNIGYNDYITLLKYCEEHIKGFNGFSDQELVRSARLMLLVIYVRVV